ncbi:RDD family protein [Pseudonocardia sp. CA-142604]|uniref:RDD family protein n=1 Tax=Pseudonocardia sp. CA-142604 TaxID=3240024 RepID=UPI003D8C88C1
MSVPHLATQPSQRAPYVPVPATYGQRVGGFLIDVGIPMGLLFTVLIAALIPRDRTLALVVYAISAVVAVVFVLWNSGYCQGRTGQSLGKRALGVRLVGAATGKPVGFRRAVGRQIAHLFDAIPFLLGYAWPLWDEQKQTFADKMCRTLVVQADL